MAAPTPVQAAVLPPALRGTHVLACAPTGTGKSAAFVLPLLQRLSADVRSLYALILTPTRELAYQLAQTVGVLGARLPVRVATLVGGVDGAGQTAAFDAGVHVVIATPGRAAAVVAGAAALSDWRRFAVVVLDEADRLLDGSFAQDMDVVLDAVGVGPRRGDGDGGGSGGGGGGGSAEGGGRVGAAAGGGAGGTVVAGGRRKQLMLFSATMPRDGGSLLAAVGLDAGGSGVFQYDARHGADGRLLVGSVRDTVGRPRVVTDSDRDSDSGSDGHHDAGDSGSEESNDDSSDSSDNSDSSDSNGSRVGGDDGDGSGGGGGSANGGSGHASREGDGRVVGVGDTHGAAVTPGAPAACDAGASGSGAASAATAAVDAGAEAGEHYLTVKRLTQTYVFLPSALKDVYLCHYLMSPTAPAGTLLVFTTHVATAVYLAALLPAVGVPRVAAIHAGLSQADRLATLRSMQAGTLRAVVATDVVARGLDLPAVAGVVNYDLPRRPSVYVHRVGRTARAGRRGVAVSFVGERDIALVHAIEAVVGVPLSAAPGFSTEDVLAGMGEVVKARALVKMALADGGVDARLAARAERNRAQKGAGKTGPTATRRGGRPAKRSRRG
ncbi:hypothetical protein MMPV_008237 [Pyropia vietnamensis]